MLADSRKLHPLTQVLLLVVFVCAAVAAFRAIRNMADQEIYLRLVTASIWAVVGSMIPDWIGRRIGAPVHQSLWMLPFHPFVAAFMPALAWMLYREHLITARLGAIAIESLIVITAATSLRVSIDVLPLLGSDPRWYYGLVSFAHAAGIAAVPFAAGWIGAWTLVRILGALAGFHYGCTKARNANFVRYGGLSRLAVVAFAGMVIVYAVLWAFVFRKIMGPDRPAMLLLVETVLGYTVAYSLNMLQIYRQQRGLADVRPII